MTDETTNIWAYLMNVAPVVVVMSLAVYELWKKNNVLIDKIHERDLQNLKTLEQMLAALKQIEAKGDHHFDELKKHVSERVQEIKSQL